MKIERDIKIIEAILFASNEPVSEDDLREKITNKNNFNPDDIDLPSMNKTYEEMIKDHPFLKEIIHRYFLEKQ